MNQRVRKRYLLKLLDNNIYLNVFFLRLTMITDLSSLNNILKNKLINNDELAAVFIIE